MERRIGLSYLAGAEKFVLAAKYGREVESIGQSG
jgi:hypothetical protein